MFQYNEQVMDAKSSNRTFMELKYGRNYPVQLSGESSNRTFMELKFCLHDDVGNVPIVLIAPLWN